jgi:RimJ/RimL family protein N-acetyltransferase
VDTSWHDDHPLLDPHPRDVPPGYPREYERRIRLTDGRHVRVRPLVPTDAAALGAAIRAADPQTLRRRFLGGPPHVTPALLEHLTTLDYVDRFALAAGDEETGTGVAIARYEPLGEGVAEVAVAVDPAWRCVGLATALIELLAEAALDRGIHTFAATYLAENQPVAALRTLMAKGGRQRIREGIAEFAVSLDRDRIEAALAELANSELDDSTGRPESTVAAH